MGMGIFSAGNCSTKCNKTFAIIKKNKTAGRERDEERGDWDEKTGRL